MKALGFSLGALLLSAASLSQAVTLKYELTDIHSGNGSIQFPNMNFNNATSAIITVEKNMGQPPEVTRVDLRFANLKGISATQFSTGEWGRFEAYVPNAWVYREVKLQLEPTPFEPNNPMHISGFVSDKSSFIGTPMQDEWSNHLFMVHGTLTDITPNKIADTVTTKVNGKNLTLTLKSRLGVAPQNSAPAFAPEGFILDINWYGKGQKTVYLPAPTYGPDRDFFTAISLNILGTENTDPSSWMLEIGFQDPHGGQMVAPSANLMDVLNQAYPPQP
ncbi:hypothetical protein O59_003580 [Cellvibrio sp. BR]|uniref:hypothetical protein n=1 Tax=Cellvibrio sp. BR TaxID=1134474 RepID=UPI000260124A|nr:hypothetical protein [Cellvibrio sp. BR]EIK43700.1 hypothetical protein O59_003580 [Cellvibrio sp. BR]